MKFLTNMCAAAAAALAAASAANEAVMAQHASSAIPNLAGKVKTVLGPMDPERLGRTITHEHIFIDFQKPSHLTCVKDGQHRYIASVPHIAIYREPFTMKNLSAVRNGVALNRDYSYLTDTKDAIEEVMHFKRARGG